MSDEDSYGAYADKPNLDEPTTIEMVATILALTIKNLGTPIAFTEEALRSMSGHQIRIHYVEDGDYYVASVEPVPGKEIHGVFLKGGDA
jgi:hypothetical protein